MPKTAGTPLFHFRAYWGTWSRVLTTRCGTRPGSGPTVELDLVPRSWSDVEAVERISRINIRRHSTDRGRMDGQANEISTRARVELEDRLGVRLATWLLDPRTEILGLIDWDLYRRFNNGGASLHDCARPHLRHLIPAIQPVLLAAA